MEKGRVAALVLLNGNLILLGEFDQRGARGEIPFAPGRDHRDIRLQGVIAEFEPHLIIALAGGAVTDRVGPHLAGDFDLLLGDQRPRDRGAEQIEPFILGVGAKHRKDIVAHEFLAQILDEDVFGLHAEQFGLGARRREFLALAEVGGEGDDFRAIGRLQPFQNDRSVESSRIGEDDAFNFFLMAGHARLWRYGASDAARL